MANKVNRINVNLLERYIEMAQIGIAKEFAKDILRVFETSPELLNIPKFKEIICAWVETAEISMDDKTMREIKEAEDEFTAGGGVIWNPAQNIR